MIVTEEEAKTKQCQETFSTVEWHYCIGSACMGWRWLDPTLHAAPIQAPGKLGYCGKVGKP